VPIVYQPLISAPQEYSFEDEDLFRAELETYLLSLSAAVNEATSVLGGEASPSSKRESLLLIPAGVTTYA
jgi:hypothetical protein